MIYTPVVGSAEKSILSQSWTHAEKGNDFYAVCIRRPKGGRLLFLEAPDFGGELVEDVDVKEGELLVHPVREAVLRLFLNKDEAEYYRETVSAYMDIDPELVEVTEVPLDMLFDLREALIERAKHECDAGLRFDISTVDAEQFLPDTIDIVWSSERSAN
jgi:hypothetical protein